MHCSQFEQFCQKFETSKKIDLKSDVFLLENTCVCAQTKFLGTIPQKNPRPRHGGFHLNAIFFETLKGVDYSHMGSTIL